jgi:ClpP class serine protease
MQFSPLDILWVFIIFSTLMPVVQHKVLEMQRLSIIKKIEKMRHSRVIVMIHRQDAFSFFNLPLYRYIDIEDSESVLRAIRFTPKDLPIDIILHTPGGLVLAAEQIASALVKHKAKITIFVPHYAMSGGTLLAIAADEIVMDENAVLGPVDPQLGEYPASSIIAAVRKKPAKDVSDRFLILADVSRKALDQVNATVISLLQQNGVAIENAKKLAKTLSSGRWTHDYPIDYKEAKKLGLAVKVGLPDEMYDLMDKYPQATNRRPSVTYIPIPYQREPDREKKYAKR